MSGLQFAFVTTLPMLSVGFALAFARLVRGPSLPDRVVALDLMAIIGIGFICAYAIVNDQSVLLNVATLFALVAFLGTVAFAYYVSRGA